jgi:hypothetical protein
LLVCGYVYLHVMRSSTRLLQYHKRHDFQQQQQQQQQQNRTHTKCVFISLQILSEPVLILRTIQRDIAIPVYRSSCKVSVILVSF